MAKHITSTTRMKTTGSHPKIIEEYIGAVNTKTNRLSIAHMRSPQGWSEPGQTPEFDEYTIVLKGTLHVKTQYKNFEVVEGEAFIAEKDEWVQYSTPDEDTEYIAVCIPAFTNDIVNRDAK
ncbi:MAG: cupin [Ignavibacteria bacterium]|nr:MAG: cupin [Ignavibacteria bacterium]